MAKVQTPSGFRDFLPDPFRKRAELMRRIREVYESFGFEGMETPCLENLSVFAGKAGAENEKLMFKVLKRGADLQRALEKQDELADLGLRFDLTVPLARYYATHRAELPAVFKRYQIGPVWRAERAQHGRYREFIQCDVDVLGSSSMLVEAEVVLATAAALAKLGFSGLTVRLNSRPLLRQLLHGLGIPEEQAGAVLIGMDKLDKVSFEEVKSAWANLSIPAEALDRLGALFSLAQAGHEHGAREELLREVEARAGQGAAPHVAQIRQILHLTPPLPSGRLVFDPFLARGIDYYTGPIFEVAAEGVPFSLAGGGRFDELIGKIGGVPTPACGFSIGFERVYVLMEERGMFGGASRAADVLLAVPSEEACAAALKLGTNLRAAGLRVDVFPGVAKLPQQYQLAEKKGLPFAVLADPAKLNAGNVEVRELATRQNTLVPADRLAAWLRGRLKIN